MELKPAMFADASELRPSGEVRPDKTSRSARLEAWFMQLSLAVKTKTATWLGLGGLNCIALLALIGFAFPELRFQFSIAVVTFAALSTLACLKAVVFMLNRIIAPVNAIVDDMQRLSSGERIIEIGETDRADEIGEIARALQNFVISVEEVEDLRSAAEEAQLSKQRELAQLAEQFEQMIGDVANVVANAASGLKSTASSMTDAAERTIAQASAVSEEMKRATEATVMAASASDESALTISEISRQAAQSAEAARDAGESYAGADAAITSMSGSARQIADIAGLIQSIAQRTNLLALNASIEAARGGEAGRGFAVVASEVKELASQASKATEEVVDKIGAMQKSTRDSINALETIGQRIELVESGAVSIASAVDQQSVAGQDLARSIDAAARASDAAFSRIDDVRRTSETTGLAAKSLLASAGELDGQASILREKVTQFVGQIRSANT